MKDNDQRIIELEKQKEQKDRQLLALEWIIGLTSSITFLTLIFIASYIELPTYLMVILIVLGSIILLIGVGSAIRIEQTAGCYECSKCHNKYIPTYKSVLFAPHINRTRYMKCPNCKKYSWNKKRLT